MNQLQLVEHYVAKGSAQGFRKAIKTACASTGATSCETHPANGAYVFTIAC